MHLLRRDIDGGRFPNVEHEEFDELINDQILVNKGGIKHYIDGTFTTSYANIQNLLQNVNWKLW